MEKGVELLDEGGCHPFVLLAENLFGGFKLASRVVVSDDSGVEFAQGIDLVIEAAFGLSASGAAGVHPATAKAILRPGQVWRLTAVTNPRASERVENARL